MTPKGRVLLIEDEETIGRVLADLLEDEGYEVRWALHGAAGLELVDAWRPDLIVLDLMMPVLDGWAFRAEQLRRPGAAARVPVVVLSGAHDARAQAGRLGAVAAVVKPFDLEEFVATVDRALAGQPV